MNTSPYIDLKFIRILEHRLDNARFVQNNNFNCKCPICNEGSSPYKRRFYIGQASDGEFKYNCFNCGEAGLFRTFLRLYHPDLFNQYTLEKFDNTSDNSNDTLTFKQTNKIQSLFDKPIFKSKLCNLVENEPLAIEYLKSRCVPEYHFNKFVHVNDYKAFLKDIGYVDYEDIPADARLVMLLYGKDKKLIGAQGRSYDKEAKIRYSTVKLGESDLAYIPKGLDYSKTIYVTEGIYDALMLKNSVATLSSNLERMYDILGVDNLVLVYDNEPRNKFVMKNMKSSIDNKRKVFIPDSSYTFKDLNEAIVTDSSLHFTHDTLQSYIDSRVFSYPQSLMEFMTYNKMRLV